MSSYMYFPSNPHVIHTNAIQNSHTQIAYTQQMLAYNNVYFSSNMSYNNDYMHTLLTNTANQTYNRTILTYNTWNMY
jgi:hypothetical protein